MVRGWFPSRGHRNNTTITKKKKFGIRFFRLNTLRIATNNFSTIVGCGGYGSVYKGVLPDDGRTVAIKRILKPYSGFLEMVELMSHLRHRNIIQVIGCCAEKGEQILVCEFAENGDVWNRLHSDKWPALDWKARAALCIGTARALSYLHEDVDPGIIHLDIKSSNILLDANFVPKIADFDLMFIACGNRALKGISGFECADAEDTQISTNIRGTVGYMDPDYLLRGELTEKVDVYSFGITMLEIVTGRRVVDLATEEEYDRMILNWVIRVRKQGTVLEIVDPKLTDFPKEDVQRFIDVALLCTRATPKLRPTMFDVVHMLYGRHKSDGEISEMALGAIADQPDQWSIGGGFHSGSMSSMSVGISGNAEATDISSSMRIDCAAEMQSREDSDESSILPNRKDGSRNKGECSSSKASSNNGDQSCPEDVVKDYFEKSMEKIMRFQVAKHSASNRTTIMNQTIVMNKSSKHKFMEAVYPPFLSGEYRTSRVLYSQRPTPL